MGEKAPRPEIISDDEFRAILAEHRLFPDAMVENMVRETDNEGRLKWKKWVEGQRQVPKEESEVS